MKRHITANQWSNLDRANLEASRKIKDFYSDFQREYELKQGGFVTVQYEPIWQWLDIGNMLAFIAKNGRVELIIDNGYYNVKFGDRGFGFLRPIVNIKGKEEVDEGNFLCDALWKCVRYIAEKV